MMLFICLIVSHGLLFLGGYLMRRRWRKVRAPQNVPGKPAIAYENRDRHYLTQDVLGFDALFTEEQLRDARNRAFQVKLDLRAANIPPR